MRVWINGKLSAFQAADMGSIPITRLLYMLDMRYIPPQGVAQSGSAPVLGTGGRRFKSCHPELLYCLYF